MIIPCYNEKEALPLFVERINAELSALDPHYRFELLFVDDGSQDETRDLIADIVASDPRCRALLLSRNFGKEAAMTAALEHCRGDAAIPIDVDLQDPPELIAQFLHHWSAGIDMVYGVRADRVADGFLKQSTAGAFYSLFNRFSPTPIPENAGDYRILDRRVIDAVNSLPERNRFLKGLVGWVGFSTMAIPYTRPNRSAGESGFNYRKLWNFAIDGIVGFSALPIKIWTYVGLSVALAAFVYASWIIVQTLAFGIDVPGYASIMVALLILSAVQLISIGVLGEYVSRMFIEVKQRPTYIIDRQIEAADEPPENSTP